MKKFGYYEKLSLAARWFLSREEAEGVIEDYRDILQEVESPEQAEKRFGPPGKLVRGLADSKKVRRWHLFFIIMAFCALVPFITIFWQGSGHNYDDFLEPAGDILLCGVVYLFGLDIILGGSNSKRMVWVSILVLTAAGIFIFMLHPIELLDSLLAPIERIIFGRNFPNYFRAEHCIFFGGIVSMLYFRFGKNLKKPLLKSLIFTLCAVFFVIACLYGFVMYCFHLDFGPFLHIFRMKLACELGAVLFLMGALGSVAMARMYDYRWRAVYILCLTGLVLCFEMHNLWWNMSPSLWQIVDRYSAGMEPSSQWVREVTSYFTWDLGFGLVLAAVGLV